MRALEGLVVAEVEFPSEDEAGDFEPPAWIGEEVTGDERYLNETLATRGRPSIAAFLHPASLIAAPCGQEKADESFTR